MRGASVMGHWDCSQRTSSLRGEGGLKKRTALPFPILFVKDFSNLKDEGGRGCVCVCVCVKKSLFLEDVLCGWSLVGKFIYTGLSYTSKTNF